jgi:hypothetical protein
MIHDTSTNTAKSHHHDSKVQDLDQSPYDPNYNQQPITTGRMGETNLVFDETPDLGDFKL